MAEPLPPEVLERFRLQERFDCWNRGEMELMLEMYAEDAVIDNSEIFLDHTRVQGHAALVAYWQQLRETWGGGVRLDPTEMFVLDDGLLVLECRFTGTGTRSGIEIGQRLAFLYTVRPDGKITEARLFPDARTAISAAESAAAETAG
jgi:ketosteroid isomerase-like protein